MYLGIDIGTSGVKVVAVDDADRVLAEVAHPLAVSRPRPLWSEQAPEDWWRAVCAALDDLAARRDLGKVRAIGLSGQMLGVAPVDADGRALRPALLWNDGRAGAECADLQALVPDFAERTGARAMPGFSAPKILWLARHEPGVLAAARFLLLPKDYVRLHLTGEVASDRADASATLLMDTLSGDWSPGILDACGIRREQLPRLVESIEISGTLRPALAARWGLPAATPVMGGAGDNMCGAVGAGIVAAGGSCVSLGTSGVQFLANDRFLPALGQGMHTHRHAVAGLFAQHAVVLSAAASLTWIAGVVGAADIGALVAEVEAANLRPADTPVFTPYLSGERTPHDDPHLTGTFSGLTHGTGRLHLVQAVMEGVTLAVAEGDAALRATGAPIGTLTLIGGGGRSRLWAELLAAALNRPLTLSPTGAVGPALGAARLARAGLGGPPVAAQESGRTVAPRPDLVQALHVKKAAYRAHLDLAYHRG